MANETQEFGKGVTDNGPQNPVFVNTPGKSAPANHGSNDKQSTGVPADATNNSKLNYITPAGQGYPKR